MVGRKKLGRTVRPKRQKHITPVVFFCSSTRVHSLGMTRGNHYVIMDNTMDGFLSILIFIVGAVGAAVVWFFFGKIGNGKR